MLDNVQRAAIERALNKLNSSPNYSHTMAIIERVAGKAAAMEVAALTAEYRGANAEAKLQSRALLSAEAADYWQEAQGLLAQGRLVLSKGSREAEKAFSHKCEQLNESFAERVPEHEQRMFVIHDVQTEWRHGADGYDDRWAATIDHPFPLLNPSFNDCLPVKNPVGEAQRVVLAGLLDQREPEAQVVNVKRLRRMFSDFMDVRQERDAKENRARAKVGDRHRRSAERYAKKMEREAKKAARQAAKAAKATAPSKVTASIAEPIIAEGDEA